MKLSEVPQRIQGTVGLDVAYYQEHLDRLWSLFGEDRILFGSDWPNSDHLVSLDKTIGLTQAYLATKTSVAQEKVFYLNSRQAYRWKSRQAQQS